jgi:hypothetical protein
MIKIYAEIGYGNASFCNTEIERGELEHRIAKFIFPPKIEGIYVRLWIRNKVYVLSSKNGFSITLKNRKAFKLLFGIEGRRD